MSAKFDVTAALARAAAAAKDHPPPWRVEGEQEADRFRVDAIVDSSHQDWRSEDERQGENVLETDSNVYNPQEPTARFISAAITDVPAMGARILQLEHDLEAERNTTARLRFEREAALAACDLEEMHDALEDANEHAFAARVRTLAGRLIEVEGWYARCASACGIENVPYSGPTWPGPIEAVEAAIKEGARAVGELAELKEQLAQARTVTPGTELEEAVRDVVPAATEPEGFPGALQALRVMATRAQEWIRMAHQHELADGLALALWGPDMAPTVTLGGNVVLMAPLSDRCPGISVAKEHNVPHRADVGGGATFHAITAADGAWIKVGISEEGDTSLRALEMDIPAAEMAKAALGAAINDAKMRRRGGGGRW